ncbi:unnamed protein product [Periconia digitata]|uniref:Rhodopsin domain-containing protein n=1 Tax=Periconia digitata TaxID=1303443 RepID=A0A9W4UQA9_9PLEO|nr:unnamed protein product [Periconia digitata]
MLISTQSPGTVVGVTAFLIALDIAVVVMRYYAKRLRQQPLKTEDWFCFVSLILAMGLAAVLFIGVGKKALAYPTPQLASRTPLAESNDRIITSSRLQYIFVVISVPTLGLINLSVLTFYRRIFVIDRSNLKDFRNAVYFGMMVAITLWTGGFFLSFMFACKGHFTAWWTSAISLITNCVNTLELVFAYAISDFITDVSIMLLPIPSVMSLHLPTARKIGVMFVFLLGALAILASTIRMVSIIWARQLGFNPSIDEDLLITDMIFCSMLEVAFGIIATCLPTLRPLVQTKSINYIL